MNWKKSLIVFVCFVGILKILESLRFFAHGDSLYYHLPLAKMWADHGLFYTYLNLCNALITGYFDHLYYFTVNLSETLWVGQLLSQGLHTFCSLILAAICLIAYNRDNKTIGWLGALSILTISSGSSYFIYAKNDGALASLGLFTCYYVFNPHKKPHYLVTGLLLGLLPAIKMNGLFLTIPISLIYTFQNRKNPFQVFQTALLAILVWSPLLIRNYYFIGNPIFPGMLAKIPGRSSEAMIELYTFFMSNPPTLKSSMEIIRQFFMAKLVIIVGLFFVTKRGIRETLPWLITSLVFLFGYIATNGGIVSTRFLFPVLFLNIAIIFQWIKMRNIQSPWLFALLFLVILADSKIDKSIKRIRSLPAQFSELKKNPNEFLEKESGNTQFWRYTKNTSDDGKIYVLSDQFNEIYYAPRNLILHCVECYPDAGFLYRCDQEGDVDQLAKYQYVILQEEKVQKQKENPCYKKILESEILHQVDYYSTFYTLYRLNTLTTPLTSDP